RIHSRVHRSREANCVVCSQEVVIDCSRAPDDLAIPILGERYRAVKRSVATDRDESVNLVLPQNLGCPFLSRLCVKFLAATGVENGPPSPSDIRHAPQRHAWLSLLVEEELFPQKTGIASEDPNHFVTR